MACSIVGASLNVAQGDNVDTLAVTYLATTVSGRCLVATVWGWRASDFLVPDGAITDAGTNTWVAAVRGGPQNGANAVGFYVENCTGKSSHQVTVDPTGTGNYLDLVIYEVAGAATSSALGGVAFATGNSATAATGSLSAAGANGDAEFAVMSTTSTSGAITVGTLSPAYEEDAQETTGGHENGEADHRILDGSDSNGASWSIPSENWSCVAFVIKAPGAGGSGIVRHMMQYSA